jgi:hypothetical protein
LPRRSERAIETDDHDAEDKADDPLERAQFPKGIFQLPSSDLPEAADTFQP